METYDTKDKIIFHALNLFEEKGFNGASIRDIAFAAEVNLSSISYYFSGKEGLYQACLNEFSSLAIDNCLEILDRGLEEDNHKIDCVLNKFVLEIITLYKKRPALVRLVINETLECNSSIKVTNRSFYRIFEKLEVYLKTCIQDGKINSKYDAFVLASIFIGNILQVITYDKVRKESYSLCILDNQTFEDKYLEHIIDIFCNRILDN